MTNQPPDDAADLRAPTTPGGRRQAAAGDALTPAEAHALRRSAPLTQTQFKALRRQAEHGINPSGAATLP